MDFGPGLLNDHHPQLISFRVIEGGSFLSMRVREEIVYYDTLPKAIDAEGQNVDTAFVIVFSEK